MFVEGAGVRRSTPLSTVQIGDPWKRKPRIIRFSDGAYCEIADALALAAMLGAEDATQSRRNTQWEGMPRALMVVLAVMLLMLVVGYRFGVPMVARVVANQVPASATEDLSRTVVESLDRGTFKPTTLPLARQHDLTRLFQRTVSSSSAPASIPFTLLFRSSPALGANAVALPAGTIIVTD